MPATPTGLIEKANGAQVTLQGDAALVGEDFSDVSFEFTPPSGPTLAFTAPDGNWQLGKAEV